MMRKLPDYKISIPKELYEPGDRPVFRKKTNDWRDLDDCFNSLVKQAFHASEHGGLFFCQAFAVPITRIHFLRLRRTTEDGSGVEMIVTYQKEMENIYATIRVGKVMMRARTAWLSNGIMVFQSDSHMNWFHLKPCWVGDDFIDGISIWLLEHFHKLELKARF